MLKNFLIRSLVNLHQYTAGRKRGQRYERFLVVSTTGLGDTLWATPALRELRGCFPQSYIGVLTSPIGAEILKNNPYIDESFIVEDPALPSLIKLYPILKNRVIDTALFFHASQRPILPFCRLLGAQELIGTEKLNKGLDDLLTIRTPLNKEHEIVRRLAIIGQLGVNPQSQAMDFFLTEKDLSAAESFLEQFNIPHYLPIIGLHPGAKDAFKQWWPEGFIHVGRRLAEERGCQIIVTGNASEKALVQSIASQIPKAIPADGKLSLRGLAALQKKMQLLITNDTGPMHLAAALGTPLLALFGPTNPALCGPFSGARAEILGLPPTCSPCLKKKCRTPFCMLQIEPDQVYAKAVSLLT